MEAVQSTPSAAAPVPPAAPAASPNYTPPAPPVPPTSNFEDGDSGGGGSNRIKDFFNDVNVVDVTISAFIVAAVIYSIQYHRFMMMIEKSGYADLSSRVQKLESSVAAAKKTAEVNASGNRRLPMRGRRM